MRKRRQNLENSRKRVKRGSMQEGASVASHEESTCDLSRGVRSRSRRGSRLVLDVLNTEDRPSASQPDSPFLNAAYTNRSRSSFYLILNLGATPSSERDTPSRREGEEDGDGSQEGGHSFLVRLFETFFGPVFFLRRNERRERDGGTSRDQTVYFEIRNLVINIFNILNDDLKSSKNTVTRENLSRIQTEKCGPDVEGKCSICLSNFGEDEELRLLRCKHKFHMSCVDPWLLFSTDTCPMCREPVL